jgi:hypothetical protein
LLVKFAGSQVLDKFLVPSTAGSKTLRRMAHRAHFDYTPRPGYLYVRSRMISSRCNDNFDEFPAAEIEKAWRTFIGKPVFVNHSNDDHRHARGIILDAALHRDRNPDGTPDTWVEGLMEVDAVRYPKLAQAILAGHVDRTSMGTDVQHSICSICANKATTPAEYCQHIPAQKGRRIYRQDPKSGQRVGVLCRETCYGLSFFENSLLVEPPADPTAHFLGVDTRGLQAAAKKGGKGRPTPRRSEARQRRHALEKQASLRAVQAEGEAGPPPTQRPRETKPREGDPVVQTQQKCSTCGNAIFFSKNGGVWIHSEQSGGGLPHQARPDQDGYDPATGQFVPVNESYQRHQGVRKGAPFAGYDDFAECEDENRSKDDPAAYCGEIKHRTEDAKKGSKVAVDLQHQVEADDYLRHRAVDLGDPDDLRAHLMEVHGWSPYDLRKTNRDTSHPTLGELGDDSRDWQHHELRAMHDHEHTPAGGGGDFPGAQTVDTMHFHGALTAESGPKYPNPGDHPAMKALGVHPGHVLAHYARATPEERGQGMNWYEDAHHVAKAIAKSAHPEMSDEEAAHKGAGVLAAYSPQTPWPANMFNASRSLREGKGLGGPGSGMMASGATAKAADRIIKGEKHTDVLKGNKISDFAHLIEHGGNKDDNDPKVVIDRHALSVASGRRLSDDEVHPAQAAIANRHYYGHVVDAYHQAAKHLREHEGVDIHPHQLQAITWLVRQRENQAEDRASATGAGKGRANAFQKHEDAWNQHFRDHYDRSQLPEKNMHVPPAQQAAASLRDRLQLVLAYGETKAPADVDTLRDEECPVCGAREGYDGDVCQVCGFITPPSFLQDPDLDKAKQMDLRKDVMSEYGQAPGEAGQVPPLSPEEARGEQPVAGDDGDSQPDNEVDADTVDEDGEPVDGTGEQVDPDAVAEDGDVDLEAAEQHVNQGGEAFTKGPNAPDDPGEPEGPEADAELDNEADNEEDIDPDEIEDAGQAKTVPGAGQESDDSGVVEGEVETLGAGDEPPDGPPEQGTEDGEPVAEGSGEVPPGTPEDGEADLLCPVCGFTSDAAQPTTVGMDDPESPDATGPGMMIGQPCPNCGQGTMMSIPDLEKQMG